MVYVNFVSYQFVGCRMFVIVIGRHCDYKHVTWIVHIWIL